MTLIAQTDPDRTRAESISAFGTPNIVHFCMALLVASILSVPWDALRPAGLAVTLCGLAGSFYSLVVMRRARRQRGYQPVFEDWLWHIILPMIAYVGLLVAGARLESAAAGALLAIGGAALLLVFIGIHNAWDTVTYLTLVGRTGTAAPAVKPGPQVEPPAGGGAKGREGPEAAG